MNGTQLSILAALVIPVSGCLAPVDYSEYLTRFPRSVLVLPPLNDAVEVEAPDMFMSTVTTPLAERGYYVFPIAVVDQVFKDNGVPTPGDMHQVSHGKLREIFGADAALYVVIENWTTQYLVLVTQTTVTIDYRLVDLSSSAVIWHQKQTMVHSSGGGGLAEMLVAAAVDALVKAFVDPYRPLAIQANVTMFNDSHRGLLTGERHPDFEKDLARAKQREAKRVAAAQ